MGKNVQHIQVKTTGAKKSQKAIKGVNNGLANMAKKAGLAAAAYFGSQALLGAIKSSIDLFGKQEEAEKKLRFAAGEMTDALIRQANALQQNTRFGDEQIIAQQAYLASLGLTQQQIKDTISASVDLAAATGMTLESAVMNTSKTLSGMAGELGEKLGPAFRELSIESLKAGDGIKFIAEQFGGTAKADAESFTGQLEQMKNAVGDAQEAIGEALSPAIKTVAKFIKQAAEGWGEWISDITKTRLERTIEQLESLGIASKGLVVLKNFQLDQEIAKLNKELDNINPDALNFDEATQQLIDATQEQSDLLLEIGKIETELTKRQKIDKELRKGIIEDEIIALNTQYAATILLDKKRKIDAKRNELKKELIQLDLDLGITQEKRIKELEDEIESLTHITNLQSEIVVTKSQIVDLDEKSKDNNNETLSSFEEYVLQQQNLLEKQIAQNKLEKERLDNQREFIKLHYEDAVALGMVSKEQQLLNKYMEEGMSKNEARIAVKVKEEEVKKIKEVEQALIKKHNLTKDFNLKEAHADAYGMAAEAYKALAGIPIIGPALGVAAAAVAYAAGMSYKAGILKAQYGADFVTDGPQMMMVGEGSGPERVQVTPLSDPNLDGPQGQGITLNISGNVLHESFIEDNVIPQIREGLRLGENMGI